MSYEAVDAPLLDVIGATSNRPHGHIALGSGDGPAQVTFTDLGDGHLAMWAYASGRIDPAGARNLAAELLAWAERHEQEAA